MRAHRDALLDRLDFLLPDALEPGEFVLIDRFHEFFDIGDAPLLPQQRDGLGPKPRNIEHRQKSRRHRSRRFFKIHAPAFFDVLLDNAPAPSADALDPFQFVIKHRLLDVESQILKESADFGKGDGLKNILALDLDDRGELGEQIREFVIDRHPGSLAYGDAGNERP